MTADFQAATNQQHALAHPGQTPMARERGLLEGLRVDTPAVITHAQPELSRIVADVHLDQAGVGVPDRIAHGFGGDAIHIVPAGWGGGGAAFPRR